MTTLADINPATIRCRIDALTVGDKVLTPAHRWETVTGLHRGERYSRSIRVATSATGPDHPYVWVNGHTVLTRRYTTAGRS
jgi:hypothetical protein